MKYTLYILVDKGLNKGQRIAQAAHAAVELARDHSLPENHWDASFMGREEFEKWLQDPKLVCLAIDSEEIEAFAYECARKYWLSEFKDDDFNVTTYAVGPVPRGEGRSIFAGLKLA